MSKSEFKANAVTPYATLGSSYDRNKFTYQTAVLIENTTFIGNVEESDYPPSGSSGLIALNFVDLIKTNAYIFNVSLVIRNCQFQNNRLPMYGSSTQFLQVNGAERHAFSMLMDDCLFTNNIFSLSFTLASISQSSCFVSITNNRFVDNTSPKIDYGIIHVSTSGISNSTDFVYSNNIFSRNTGACLVIESESLSNHTIINTTISDHQILVDDISPSYLLYVSGHKNKLGDAYSTSVHIDYLNVTNNRISGHSINDMVNLNAIASFVEVEFYGSNMNFVQNSFVTPLSFTSIQGVLLGHNVFELNQAMYGGAISIWEVAASSKPLPQVINTTVDTDVQFINNYADYGGAVYINSQSFVQSLANTGSCQGSFVFTRNHARVAGQSLYTSSSTLPPVDMHCFNLTNQDEVATSPHNLSINPSSLTVFPGQSIYLNVSLVDGLNRSSSCLSSVKLYCDMSTSTLCEQINSGIQLLGPPSLFLFGRSISMDTQLKISLSLNELGNQTTLPIPKLKFVCSEPHILQSHDQFTSVSIVIRPECPFGFVYNEHTHVCECQFINDGGNNFRCSVNKGKACVRKSYWVGSAGNKNVTAHCPYPRCKLSSTPCPLEYQAEFVSLPDHADDQCLPNRGGILCSQCSSDAFPTFEGVRCTKLCKPAYPYVIVLLGVLFQVMLVILILAALRLKVEFGSGFLYGPVLFLAVAGELPFGYYAEFETLRVFLSGFKSIFLVNLELFGEIPWCFGKGFNQLESFMFHYLGPVLVWLMLVALVFIGRCRPKLLRVIQDSPVQAISMLIILSFWSVVYTSIMVLLPVQLEGETRIYIQPESKYLHSWHILCVASSVVILLVVVAPFLLLLVLAQFSRMWRRIRMYRIQPLLDEFQSCYQDRYRWYAVVYFITWIVILVCKQSTLAIEIIIIFLLSLHFFLQPYKRHILNVIDMLLLLDLLLLVTIMDTYSIITRRMAVIVYLLVGLPLLYIVIGCSATGAGIVHHFENVVSLVCAVNVCNEG